MNDLKFQGVWIPTTILIDENLTDKEKIVLSIILCLSSNNNCCYIGNRYLSKLLNITINRVSKIISSLKNKKYIDVKVIYEENSKYIKSRELKPTKSLLERIVKNDNTYCQKEQWAIVPKNKDIKNNNNKYKNNISFSQRHYTDEELNKLYSNLIDKNN